MLSAIYVDLDGTLLGRRGSLMHDASGTPSPRAVQAVHTCLEAGVEIVLTSARERTSVAELARLLGQQSYIFELGACLVLDRTDHWLTGALAPSELTVFEQIAASAAPDVLMEQFPGRLAPHAHRHGRREASEIFCGLVDATEADAVLAEQGFEHLRLVDNGVERHRHRPRELRGLSHVRAYALVPAGVSKAAAVAAHRDARGLSHEATAAIGDSPADLLIAREVGQVWVVGNAVESDPALASQLAQFPNARVTRSGPGGAVYEAVEAMLGPSAAFAGAANCSA